MHFPVKYGIIYLGLDGCTFNIYLSHRKHLLMRNIHKHTVSNSQNKKYVNNINIHFIKYTSGDHLNRIKPVFNVRQNINAIHTLKQIESKHSLSYLYSFT